MHCGLCKKEGNQKRWIAYDCNLWNFFLNGNKKPEKFKSYFGIEYSKTSDDVREFWNCYIFCDKCRPIIRKAKRELSAILNCQILIGRIKLTLTKRKQNGN